jgi:hypothetical protein
MEGEGSPRTPGGQGWKIATGKQRTKSCFAENHLHPDPATERHAPLDRGDSKSAPLLILVDGDEEHEGDENDDGNEHSGI